jgi:uncharacterized protein YfdQ (DUF2303 family)
MGDVEFVITEFMAEVAEETLNICSCDRWRIKLRARLRVLRLRFCSANSTLSVVLR